MRVAALLAALLLVGCLGGGHSVSVSNRSSAPATIVVEVTDAASETVEFSRDFGTIEVGASDSVDHNFEPDRTYVVDATVVDVNGTSHNASYRIDRIIEGAWIVVNYNGEGKIDIWQLVAD